MLSVIDLKRKILIFSLICKWFLLKYVFFYKSKYHNLYLLVKWQTSLWWYIPDFSEHTVCLTPVWCSYFVTQPVFLGLVDPLQFWFLIQHNQKLYQIKSTIIYIAHLKTTPVDQSALHINFFYQKLTQEEQYPSLNNVPTARDNCMPQSKGVLI